MIILELNKEIGCPLEEKYDFFNFSIFQLEWEYIYSDFQLPYARTMRHSKQDENDEAHFTCVFEQRRHKNGFRLIPQQLNDIAKSFGTGQWAADCVHFDILYRKSLTKWKKTYWVWFKLHDTRSSTHLLWFSGIESVYPFQYF